MARNINKLLTLVLREYEIGRNGDGLCYTIALIDSIGVIKHSEYQILMQYIRDNKPFSFRDLFGIEYGWYWKKGVAKPRIKWLKKHIERTSK